MNAPKRLLLLMLFTTAFAAFTIASASNLIDDSPIVEADVTWHSTEVHRGRTALLAIQIKIQPPYHINPSADQLVDEFLIPTQIEVVDITGGLKHGPIQYPKPSKMNLGTADNARIVAGYEGTVVAYLPVQVTAEAALTGHDLSLLLNYQACTDVICLPGESLTIKTRFDVVSDDTSIIISPDQGLFEGYQPNGIGLDDSARFTFFDASFVVDAGQWGGYLALLGLAVLGGFLLNLTPCVLPVIPIKMMSLSRAAGTRGRCFGLGAATGCGIVVFWVVLGAAISLVSGFTLTNQLFQYPGFSVGAGVVIVLMAVGMFGVFSFRLPHWVYRAAPSNETLFGSLCVGVMTAVLSTPCTGPFMGTAATWAVGQALMTTMTVFLGIGVGMALPYVLLGGFPKLIGWVPNAGATGELVKQLMGIFMLAAGAYFVGVGVVSVVSVADEPAPRGYWWGPVVLCVIAAGWLSIKTFGMTGHWGIRVSVLAGSLVFGVATVLAGLRLTDTGPVDWVYYTPERFAEARDGRNVIVEDFTAEWCINCRVLEETVLSDPRVVELLGHEAVVPVKVDLTSGAAGPREKLRNAGSVAIPLLVIYGKEGQVIFKSEAYTVDQVVGAIRVALEG